jgi:hypothetical protein
MGGIGPAYRASSGAAKPTSTARTGRSFKRGRTFHKLVTVKASRYSSNLLAHEAEAPCGVFRIALCQGWDYC